MNDLPKLKRPAGTKEADQLRRFYRSQIPQLPNFALISKVVFMATKRRTEIIVETERIIVVPQQTMPVQLWCPRCSARVEMLTPEQSAALVQVTPRVVYRWVEAQLLHFIEEPDGRVLICRNSLYGQTSESR